MKEPVVFKNSKELLDASAFRVTETVEKLQQKVLFKEWAEPSTEVAHFDLIAREGAQLEYVLFQNHAMTADTLALITVRAERNSRVKLTVIQNGAAKSQLKIEAHCAGEGAEVEIRGLQNARGTQKLMVDFHAIHAVPHTKSDLQVWCIADDQAQSIFNGLMTIAEGSHHTESYQKNRNLLLSNKATIDTFPKLFIANHDVKAAHGSSTSTLEPDQFMYLQSRGIDHEQAEKMLVRGFIRQAIEWISDETIRTRIEKTLNVYEEVWEDATV
jgi:Fe-S cluster assembly protein SufD